MSRLLIIAALLILTSLPSIAQAESPVSGAMVGASPAPVSAYPYAVRVDQEIRQTDEDQSYYQGFCSGSLIAPTYVLTAAHCVVGDIGDYPGLVDQGAVRVSFLNLAERPSIKVVRVAYYGSFQTNEFGSRAAEPDLAILQLAAPAPAAPVQLGSLDQNASVPALELGYGALTDKQQEQGKMQSRLYQGSMLTASDNYRCFNYYRRSEISLRPEIEICATAAKSQGLLAAACNGDSGGPLIDRDGVQIGVTSWAQYGECQVATSERSTVFARVSAAEAWLRRQTGAELFGLPALAQDLTVPSNTSVSLSRASSRSVRVSAGAAGSDWSAEIYLRAISRVKGKRRYYSRIVTLSPTSPSKVVRLPRRMTSGASQTRVKTDLGRFVNSLMNGLTNLDYHSVSLRP